MEISNDDVVEIERMKAEIRKSCKKHSKNELIAYITTLLWENAQLRAETIAIKKLIKENDEKANIEPSAPASDDSTGEE